MTEARKMAAMACNALEDKKAVDIKVIDIEQNSSLADLFYYRQWNQPQSGSGNGRQCR